MTNQGKQVRQESRQALDGIEKARKLCVMAGYLDGERTDILGGVFFDESSGEYIIYPLAIIPDETTMMRLRDADNRPLQDFSE